MQTTTTTRRFDPRQIKQAALAIAILTSAAIGVTTASIVRDAGDTDSGQAVIASASAGREREFGYQFMEQNLNFPVGVTAPAVSRYADYQFMEQNLNLLGSGIAPATSRLTDFRFLEMNLDLPGTVPSVAPDWRMIEKNSWGEGFVLGDSTDGLVPPSATDSPQHLSPDSSY